MATESVEKKMGKIRVACYSRVSTDKQEFDRQVSGIKRYLKANPQYAKVEQDYCDFAKSGGGFERKALTRLLAHAKSNQFEVVISYGLDRIGRKLVESVNYIKELKKAGVVYIDCERNLTYGMDATQDFIIHQMLALAEMELVNTRKRVQDVMDSKKVLLAEHGCKLGSPSILEDWVVSPIPVRADKKGMAVKPNPKKLQRFKDYWAEGVTVRNMASMFRYPVNLCCDHCGGKPPRDENVKAVMAQRCRCGRCTSEKTIHVTRKKLGLPQRSPHAFGAKKMEDELPEEYKIDWTKDN